MLAKAGGYYRSEFQGFRGARQGDPLSPTIFNMVVDVLAIHWVEVILDNADKQSRCRQ